MDLQRGVGKCDPRVVLLLDGDALGVESCTVEGIANGGKPHHRRLLLIQGDLEECGHELIRRCEQPALSRRPHLWGGSAVGTTYACSMDRRGLASLAVLANGHALGSVCLGPL